MSETNNTERCDRVKEERQEKTEGKRSVETH